MTSRIIITDRNNNIVVSDADFSEYVFEIDTLLYRTLKQALQMLKAGMVLHSSSKEQRFLKGLYSGERGAEKKEEST
jgi:hypothetical protein